MKTKMVECFSKQLSLWMSILLVILYVGVFVSCTSEGKKKPKSNPISNPIYSSHYYEEFNGYIYNIGKGSWVCDKNGNVIIASSRGYDWIYFHPENGCVGYFSVEKDGKEGACDMTGREIIAPKYSCIIYFHNTFEYKDSDGNFVSLGISLDSRGCVSGTSSSSSSSGSVQPFQPSYYVPVPQSGGYDNGGVSSSNSSASSASSSSSSVRLTQTHQVTRDCRLCFGSGKCNSCNGKHMIPYQFGSGYIECPNCTPNGACPSCGGSGKKVEYEYY